MLSKCGIQFGHKRSHRCKYIFYFKAMYNLVFELMEIVGITEKLTELEWQNQLGERVSEVDTIGEMVDYKVTHPEHVLFVYGVGDNICQKNDMDDQKFLVKRGCQPRIFSSTPNAY